MPTNTTNYSFKKPVVGADEDLWGGYINDNFDSLDSLLSGTTALTSLDITGDFTVDTNTLHVDSTNNRVGVGTSSPATNLHVSDGPLVADYILRANSTYVSIDANQGGTAAAPALIVGGDTDTGWYRPSSNIIGLSTAGTERVRIDASGNVGIGEASPSSNLHITDTEVTAYNGSATDGQLGAGSTLFLEQSGGSNTAISQIVFQPRTGYGYNRIVSTGGSTPYMTFTTNNSEAARIDASGNVLVGRTSVVNTASSTDVGHDFRPSGAAVHYRSGSASLYLGRQSTNGELARFFKDGSEIGSIQVIASAYTMYNTENNTGYLGSNGVAMYAWDTIRFYPNDDNVRDLGLATRRWDDIFATNATIQTSDANEKQQIASLTDAEMQAAKAISALFKTFKWNDAVTKKGDAARKHAGVIAQDVQQAMADAGLDAGDYAFFISTTWWETQTEVPAVEAVAAQDAVYDEEGNLISEAVEAVEAQEAYTRTDTYDTLEEAPEGATERTRLGIRYPELLAFIGAATEQRLASIEARLDAIGA